MGGSWAALDDGADDDDTAALDEYCKENAVANLEGSGTRQGKVKGDLRGGGGRRWPGTFMERVRTRPHLGDV